MSRSLTRELAAEFLGTLVLIALGVGVVAQVVLSGSANGSYLSINLGWGIGVVFGVLIAGGVSGAHLNPAVTVALAVHRGLPWAKVAPYAVAQIAGAFVGAALVYLDLPRSAVGVRWRHAAGRRRTRHGRHLRHLSAAVPLAVGGLVDQITGTALLVVGVFAIGDARNVAVPGWMGPLLVGTLVVGIGVAFGFNAGYAINPARDFGPRLFTAMAGWGVDVFAAGNGWWWVPVVGPMCGAVLGGFVYDACITRLHPAIERTR